MEKNKTKKDTKQDYISSNNSEVKSTISPKAKISNSLKHNRCLCICGTKYRQNLPTNHSTKACSQVDASRMHGVCSCYIVLIFAPPGNSYATERGKICSFF